MRAAGVSVDLESGDFSSARVLLPTEIPSVTAQAAEPRVSVTWGPATRLSAWGPCPLGSLIPKPIEEGHLLLCGWGPMRSSLCTHDGRRAGSLGLGRRLEHRGEMEGCGKAGAP